MTDRGKYTNLVVIDQEMHLISFLYFQNIHSKAYYFHKCLSNLAIIQKLKASLVCISILCIFYLCITLSNIAGIIKCFEI